MIVINEDRPHPEQLSAADFLSQHAGHIITGTGPVKDGGCVITVRICATCTRLHIAHNDEVVS